MIIAGHCVYISLPDQGTSSLVRAAVSVTQLQKYIIALADLCTETFVIIKAFSHELLPVLFVILVLFLRSSVLF